jgi:hypothetical protein
MAIKKKDETWRVRGREEQGWSGHVVHCESVYVDRIHKTCLTICLSRFLGGAASRPSAQRSRWVDEMRSRPFFYFCNLRLAWAPNWERVEPRLPSVRRLEAHELVSRESLGRRCWWKSGPKGGRRHNSPLNSLPSFALSREVPTSTPTRARKGNTETYKDRTRKFLANRRPKDRQKPSVLSSHYRVSVSLQGVHYL